MQEITLVITFRTDAYDQDKIEDHYPEGVDTIEQAVQFDIAAYEEGEHTLDVLIDEDAIVGIKALDAKEVK